MSNVDGSILTALEQMDPDEAQAFEEELESQMETQEQVEEDQVFDFEFNLY